MDRRKFRTLVVALVLAYFALQVVYVRRLPVVMDEFQEASTVAQFERGLPYRDFAPYKTVLGHYLQLGPYLLGRGTWEKLLAVKLAMAGVNALALGLTAWLLARKYAMAGVLCGLLLTIPMSDFLERSSEFRVDMMTAWAGLASLLLLLGGRYRAAGALAGMSFLISQKGIYYCIAGAAASLLLPGIGREWKEMPVLRFVGAAAGTVALYVLFWAIPGGLEQVMQVMFWAPRRIAVQQIYDYGSAFWVQTISRNPLFYGLAIVGIVRLLGVSKGQPDRAQMRALGLYGLMIAALAVGHRQPWPYFFLLIVPTAFVLIAALVDISLRKYGHWSPLGSNPAVIALCLGFGVALPLSRVPVNLHRDNGHQRQAVELAEHVLAPEDQYLAGVDMIYGRRQPVGVLRWVDAPKSAMLRQMDASALKVVADSVRESRLKVVIDNYRIQRLPRALHDYLMSQTAPLWGNLRIYGPVVQPGWGEFDLKFGGRYEVLMSPWDTVYIDGRVIDASAIVELRDGIHRRRSSHGFRLKLLPEGWESQIMEAYRNPRDFFPEVYVY